MTSAYTPLLGLVLPVTGELSGTWGTVWNDSGTSLIDAAIAGTTTLSTDADVTLTTTQGAANTSREAIILWTAGGTATRTITVPAQSKIYTVINKTSSTQSIKIVGAGPTTGVTIIAGESALVAWNGVDFIKISNISGAGVFSSITNTGLTSGRVVYSTTGGLETDSANLTFNGTTLTANTLNLTNALTTAYGGTGLTSYTAGDLPYYAAGTVLSKLGIGTAGQILTVNSGATAPQWSTLSGVAVTTFSAGTTGFTPSSATSGAVTLGGTLATTNGGTGLTSFTANGVVYASSTSALATGSALTFASSTLGINNTVNTVGQVATLNLTTSNTNFGSSNTLQLLTTLNNATTGESTSSFRQFNHDIGSVDAFITKTSGNAGYLAISTGTGAAEIARFTSTGLGIGTSSPATKLQVYGGALTVGNESTYAARFGNNSNKGVTIGYDTTNNVGHIGSINPAVAWTDLVINANGGNLGLGVTPKAWGGGGVFCLGGDTAIAFQGTNGDVVANAYYNAGWKYAATAAASHYYQTSGAHQWYTAPSGTAGAAITFTQAMTLDASGNLGVGTTSPASKFNVADSSINCTITVTNSSSNFQVQSNTNDGYFNLNGSGNIIFRSGTPSVSERARIDAAGNLGLGVTPSAWYSSFKGLDVANASYYGNINNGTAFITGNTYINSSLVNIYKTSNYALRYTMATDVGQHIWQTAPSGTAGATATFTQAMTLDASGNLLVGTTSGSDKLVVDQAAVASASQFKNSSGTATAQCVVAWQANTTGDNVFHQFFTETSATSRGSISYNRGAGLVAYNVTSDYRAKDIIGPVIDSGALIDSVPVYMGKMKDATQERPMFIAHEVPAYAHTGEKDAVDADGNPVYQQMDASALIPVMWAEIQDLRKRLAAAGI